tara:strand:+ start:3953 stop:4129 length:177 start_codon:yes stop_codon:yes gene_type:complete
VGPVFKITVRFALVVARQQTNRTPDFGQWVAVGYGEKVAVRRLVGTAERDNLKRAFDG